MVIGLRPRIVGVVTQLRAVEGRPWHAGHRSPGEGHVAGYRGRPTRPKRRPAPEAEAPAAVEATREHTGMCDIHEFNTAVPRVDDPEATDELLHRTPGYVSWQEGDWVACCGDYCAYLGPVGTAELEGMGIADDLFEADGSLDGWEGAREDKVRNGWFTGHLFRCLHCGRYHLRADVS